MDRRTKIYFKNKRQKYFLIIDSPIPPDPFMTNELNSQLKKFFESDRKVFCMFTSPGTTVKVITL